MVSTIFNIQTRKCTKLFTENNLLQGNIVEDLKNKIKYLRNTNPKTQRELGENQGEPKPDRMRVEP